MNETTTLDKAVDAIITMIDGRLATWQLNEKIESSHNMIDLMKRDKEKLRMMTYNILRDDIISKPLNQDSIYVPSDEWVDEDED